MRHQWRIRRKKDVRLSGKDHYIDKDRAAEHKYIGNPPHSGGRKPDAQKHGASKIEGRYLKKYYPDYKHIEAVRGKYPVKPFGPQQMHRGPARKGRQKRRGPAHGDKDERRQGIGLYKALDRQMHLESGYGASSKVLFSHF